MTRRLAPVLLTALMALNACVKTSTTVKGPDRICFEPVIGTQVRSADNTELFPKDESFRVKAITSSNNVFFNDVDVSFEEDVWTSPLLPEWEEGIVLRFNAYAPADAELGGFNPFEDPTDLLIAETELLDRTSNPVNLEFTHALSQVSIRIRNGLPLGSELRVQSVSIGELYTAGDLTPDEAELWSVEGKPGIVSVFSLPEGADPIAEGIPVNRDGYTSIGGNMRMIPQHGRPYIQIVCSMKYPDTAWETDLKWVTTEPLSVVWLAGRKYTYSISVLDNELKYTTGISNWNQE